MRVTMKWFPLLIALSCGTNAAIANDEWCHIEWCVLLKGAMLAKERILIKTT